MATQLERIIEAIDDLAGKELWQCSTGVLGGEAKARYDALMEAADIIGKNIETEEQSRQRFEAWRIVQCDESSDLQRDEYGRYTEKETVLMWQAWQASQTFTEANHER